MRKGNIAIGIIIALIVLIIITMVIMFINFEFFKKTDDKGIKIIKDLTCDSAKKMRCLSKDGGDAPANIIDPIEYCGHIGDDDSNPIVIATIENVDTVKFLTKVEWDYDAVDDGDFNGIYYCEFEGLISKAEYNNYETEEQENCKRVEWDDCPCIIDVNTEC
ncbi:MAG: hypothetical protein KAJ47_01600 [Candidatus Aenigmarchaeota archaeon]|nr:hypothetical protein [Candidatus Aenigmarchaeota archaeon]